MCMFQKAPHGLLNQPFLTVVNHHFYGPLNSTVLCFLRENGEKRIGKESRKDWWYLSLGTNGQWGCCHSRRRIVYLCLCIFWKFSGKGMGTQTPGLTWNITCPHSTEALASLDLYCHLRANILGLTPGHCPSQRSPRPPLLSIPWKWGQRGEETRMNRRPPWQVKCVFHVILFHAPLPIPSSWSLSARSANTHDPKPYSVPSLRPACVLRAHL